MSELAGVAGACMGCGDVPLGEVHGHHIVNVVKNDLVAVEQYNALRGCQTFLSRLCGI